MGVASSISLLIKFGILALRQKTIKKWWLKRIIFNKLIIKISENIERFHFNKSVANIYEYVNEINKLMDKKLLLKK